MKRPIIIEAPIERPLPQNIDAERSVLGAILLDNRMLAVAIEHLKPSDFFHPFHQRIYHRMIAMNEGQVGIDLVTLSEHFQRSGELDAVGGVAYLAQLVDGVPRVTHLKHYAGIVKGKALLRHLIHSAHAIQQTALEGEQDAEGISARAVETFSSIAANRLTKDWRHKFHTVTELPDGDVDFLIEGILPAGVTFIGALSGVGKTWFALAMAKALTSGNKFLGVWAIPSMVPVLYLVPEMNGKAFRRRCARFGIAGGFYCQTISDGAPLNLADPLLAAAIGDLNPVIFLDTAIRFSDAEEENSASQNAQGIAKAIFHLIHLGARAVVSLHHRAKVNADVREMTLENVLRGTGDLGAMCDSVWGLEYDRGPGDLQYLKLSRNLIRLHVRCVKGRDFRTPEDFRIQLDPYLDQTGDMVVLTDEPVANRNSEVTQLSNAILAAPKATKVELQKSTGIGRNRIEGLAADAGWRYTKGSGWDRMR